MELEDLRAGLCREELRLTEAFKDYMLISSALAEYGHENNVPVSDRKRGRCFIRFFLRPFPDRPPH